MPRKKKTEEVKEEIIIKEDTEKVNDFGTGWSGINNRIQHELYEVKKNE